MESGSIVGQIIGWGVIAALVIAYFAAVLHSHWRDQKERRRRDGTPK